MKRFFAVSVISLLACTSILFAQERRFTIDDLLKVRRVSDPQLSPRGDLVAFTITDVDKVANKSTTQIYVVPLSGGEMRQLTNDEHSSTSPRWSPDAEKLAFISARDGESQIWTMDVSSGTLKKITSLRQGPVIRFGRPMANGSRSRRTFTRNAKTTPVTKRAPRKSRKAK